MNLGLAGGAGAGGGDCDWGWGWAGVGLGRGWPVSVCDVFFLLCVTAGKLGVGLEAGTQRAQYPLIKEYGLNYIGNIGLHIMI